MKTRYQIAVGGMAAICAICTLALYIAKRAREHSVQSAYMRKVGARTKVAWVDVRSMAPVLICSVVLEEDRRFGQHHGVEWAASRRAAIAYVRGTPAGGASTITQQVARNILPMPSATIVRKPYEILVALLLDVVVAKKEQIALYLNYAEWGPEIWGASAAARYYFSTTVDRLTLEQALILASILPDPRADVQRPSPHLLERQRRIMTRMERAGLVRFDAGGVPMINAEAMARAATRGGCGQGAQ